MNQKDPNKISVGNTYARDHAINQFLKHKPEGVAEIGINHTDSDGNLRHQKVGIDGSVSPAKITKRSKKSLYKTANKIYERSCSKSRVGFSDACTQEQWNQIFGKKEER